MKKLVILLLASVLLLAGCGAKTPASSAPAVEENVTKITDLADLPAAIQNDAVIELPEGLQNIAEAFGEYYDGETIWEHAYLDYVGDGYGLVITNASNLTIRGAGAGKTELAVESSFADVLRFENCSGVTLEKMTLGHLVEEAMCEGAVVEVNQCSGIELRDLDLYGCGTYGVENYDSQNITLKDSVIRSCSYGIVSCYNGELNVENCQMYDCTDYRGIEAYESTLTFTDCSFRNNSSSSGFAPYECGNSITFDRCTFSASESFDILYALSGSEELAFTDSCKFDESVKLPNDVVFVHTPEELFAAIAPKTSIVLLDYWYDLSGWMEETYYSNGDAWNAAHPYVRLGEVYDGVMATISGVKDLAIVGGSSSRYAANVTVSPRYADVFCFENCDGVMLANMTAGHTETGDCSGNVVTLVKCKNVVIDNCDLYGCGVEGIYADGIHNMTVTNTTVRDCSDAGLNIYEATGEIYFKDCDIYHNEWGIVYRSDTLLVLDHCCLGAGEMSSVDVADTVELIVCSLYGEYDWGDYEYPDYSDSEEYDPLEDLSAVRFDREVLSNTTWTGFFASTEGGQNWLDSTVRLVFDENGNCVLEGYWEESAHLTIDYDGSGYYAMGYETTTDFVDAMLYLYADNSVEESDLTLEMDYGESIIYFW